MKIYDVPRALVPDFWQVAVTFLAPALDYHPYLTVAGLLEIVQAGRGDLMVGIEQARMVGAGVLECVQYPGRRVGNVVAMGADPGFASSYLDAAIEHGIAWSRARGCDTIGLIGRRGWSRFLSRRHWQVQQGISAWRDISEPVLLADSQSRRLTV